MKTQEIIQQAIKIHQGERLAVGTACAHPSDSMTYELLGYDGDTAILGYGGVVKYFPANEIFDVNRVRDTAIMINLESKYGTFHQDYKEN